MSLGSGFVRVRDGSLIMAPEYTNPERGATRQLDSLNFDISACFTKQLTVSTRAIPGCRIA